jgi:hypothetical protein
MMPNLIFKAEVIEVKSRKTASLDVSYRIVLQTDDPKVLSLGTLQADDLVNVEVEVDG